MNPNCPKSHHYAPVAQWIEQWIPNPCAASSILAGGTSKIDILQRKRKQIESFIRDHSEAEFTHSICPKCAKKF